MTLIDALLKKKIPEPKFARRFASVFSEYFQFSPAYTAYTVLTKFIALLLIWILPSVCVRKMRKHYVGSND